MPSIRWTVAFDATPTRDDLQRRDFRVLARVSLVLKAEATGGRGLRARLGAQSIASRSRRGLAPSPLSVGAMEGNSRPALARVVRLFGCHQYGEAYEEEERRDV